MEDGVDVEEVTISSFFFLYGFPCFCVFLSTCRVVSCKPWFELWADRFIDGCILRFFWPIGGLTVVLIVG